ncbi:hypothetical protein V6N13_060302 [Hibiscus sabdariffa]
MSFARLKKKILGRRAVLDFLFSSPRVLGEAGLWLEPLGSTSSPRGGPVLPISDEMHGLHEDAAGEALVRLVTWQPSDMHCDEHISSHIDEGQLAGFYNASPMPDSIYKPMTHQCMSLGCHVTILTNDSPAASSCKPCSSSEIGRIGPPRGGEVHPNSSSHKPASPSPNSSSEFPHR